MGQDKERIKPQKKLRFELPREEQHKGCPYCECHKHGGTRAPDQPITLLPKSNVVHPDGRKKVHPECQYCECKTPPTKPERVSEKNKGKIKGQEKVSSSSAEANIF